MINHLQCTCDFTHTHTRIHTCTNTSTDAYLLRQPDEYTYGKPQL